MELTQEKLKEHLHYCPDSGVFTWVKARGTAENNKRAGCTMTTGYRGIRLFKMLHYEHRLAWLYMHGEWPKEQIDHINRIKNDNRIENLRCASNQENRRNQGLSKKNTHGVLGVYKHKKSGKWRATIHIDRKPVHLGYYFSFLDAVLARKMAEHKYGFHPNHGKAL